MKNSKGFIKRRKYFMTLNKKECFKKTHTNRNLKGKDRRTWLNWNENILIPRHYKWSKMSHKLGQDIYSSLVTNDYHPKYIKNF